MATEKKYLDLQGLQHLKEQKVLVKHPAIAAADPAAVKVGTDVNGHVKLGGAILPSDIGAAVPSDIGDATIKIKINGVEKDFTTNQKTDETLEWTLSDLGLTAAMHFIGTSLTALQDGSTTSTVKIKEHNSDTTGRNHSANDGDVVLYDGKEFVFSKLANAWYELGDQGSHALKSIKIEGDGTYVTGGGDLTANRKLSHKTYTAADAAAVKIGRDAGGHVVIGGALSVASNGAHTHTVSSTIPANSFLTTASGTTTKISLNKGSDTFVKSYPGVKSNLVTTTITGVSGSTIASKATAGTAIAVAKAGTEVTVAKRDATAKTIGNANVGSEVQATAYNASTPAYTASYVEKDECLTLTALGSISFTPATTSTNTIYGCSSTDAKVTPAVSNGNITPYTFENVTVPTAASATTVATGTLATDGKGGSVMTGLGTASTASALTSATVQSGTTGDVTVVTEVKSGKNSAAVTISGNAASNGAHTHAIQ